MFAALELDRLGEWTEQQVHVRLAAKTTSSLSGALKCSDSWRPLGFGAVQEAASALERERTPHPRTAAPRARPHDATLPYPLRYLLLYNTISPYMRRRVCACMCAARQ